MPECIELGTVSSRGQMAIPAAIRKEMGLCTSSKVLFFLEDDVLMIKKVSASTWAQVTRPLREAKKRIPEAGVTGLIHELRKK